MLATIALTLLATLELARRALEPACPECASKEWTAHSTQLQCSRCGWCNGAIARSAAAPPPPSAPEQTQYEFCLG
jgi:ribosomal protein S27AE